MYRTIGAILFGIGVAISFYFRRKSETEGEPVSFKAEGLFVKVALRATGLAMWLSVILWLINPRWMAWAQVSLADYWRWIGVTVCFLSLPLSYWIFSSIGTNITQTVETRSQHKLVTNGPYRFVRHPLYTVGMLTFFSYALMAANWFIALTTTLVQIMLLMRLPKEEQKLIDRFGDEYRQYMRITGRLFPRL